MSKWISVEDRLPPIGERVLTMDNHGHICDRALEQHDNRMTGSYIYIFYPDGLKPREHIKYWMPLPEPPGKRRVATETCLFCGQEITGKEGEK